MSSKDKKVSKDKKAKGDDKKGEKSKKDKAPAAADAPAAASVTESTVNSAFMASHQMLTHFDETNGIAIARTDNTTGRIIVPLTDAYMARYNKLKDLLNAKLIPKRNHLDNLRVRLNSISIEVDAKRKAIEKETMTDTEQILARLKNIESMRQSAILHQINIIQTEIEAIDRLRKRVEVANLVQESSPNLGITYTSAAPGSKPVETIQVPRAVGMVELIQQFGDLTNAIESLSIKPISVQVDFPTDDFPREISERLDILARSDRYVHAVAVKDQMLWSLMQEKAVYEEKISDEKKMNADYAQEVASWAEFAGQLSQQVLALKTEKEAVERRNRELLALLRRHNIYCD